MTGGAGRLRERFAFDSRTGASDGRGNTVSAWHEQFRCAAARMFLRGGETIMAARLEQRQPTIVVVRACAATRAVTTDWRCRDVRTGDAFNIRSVQPGERRDYIEFLCERGPANG